MPDSQSINNDFLSKITEIIEENITNEQFGVSELADKIGMSRSNLLRKVKKITELSVSQFISQVRLQHARKMLRETSLTVSEISYKVGFSSPSYFIKCFRDHYGYPPGETGKMDANKSGPNHIDQKSPSHQLAAIMFTDIQGFTSLMQQDEEKAIEFRNRHREIFNATTKKFRGKILQYWGDGTLSTFSSAIDAVKCGIEMQLAFREKPQIPLRIGIHSGDIIIMEDDIIGDGVNVASRIESLAVAGSVFISEKVYDEVKNQSGIHTVSRGVFELKNVGKPLEVYAVTNQGLVVPEKDQISGKEKKDSQSDIKEFKTKRTSVIAKWAILILAAIIIGYLVYKQFFPSFDQTVAKKSIAVLPFINDSYDSSNIYIINGLMESTLNNLQKIRDLRVISRTSVEKYRNNSITIPEIGRELNVKYIVEGSGQKMGDQISLHIQLIEASTDKHLWSEQYTREANDIFNLQMELAKNIADKIQVIITPEEEERINKPPTENLVAYDYFLKGHDLFFKGTRESLEEAIPWFKKAIEHDNQFALAYADVAISYYYLDIFLADKKYSDSINNYSDKALLFDPKLPQALIAKAFFYMHYAEYELAIPYLEMALEYNPNSAQVINTLTDFYANYVPNTEKYLEYALKGIKLDIASHDSITASFIYLHVSNAFIQTGFVKEAETYINKSLNYNPDNLYSVYVKAYIQYAGGKNLTLLKKRLTEALKKDTTRIDIIQEIGKTCYYMHDYQESYKYYKRYLEITESYGLDVYPAEDAKIGIVLSEVGLKEASDAIFEDYKNYAENDKSIYKHLSLAAYNSYQGDSPSAIKHLKLFSQEDNYHYWTILFLEMDPLMDNIKGLPEFKKIMKEIKSKFWKNHKQIKASLEEKELI